MNHADELAREVVKKTLALGGFHPLKSKQILFIVLKDRVLEVYRSVKDEKNGKKSKFSIDLSTALNVHLHVDVVLKKCISLMLPNETFLFRPESSVEQLNDWFSSVIDRAREARATALARPVFREEYFEIAWDVEVVKLPKLKKKMKDEDKVDDLASNTEYESRLIGKRRLCMYPHGLLIVEKGVVADEDAIPPIRKDSFMEFPMNAISNYGRQEKYFFFRVGRCAPTGAGEIWCASESGERANLIYEKVNLICERESEKRRAQGTKLLAISNRTLRNQAHRERSHTTPQRPQIDLSRFAANSNLRKTSTSSLCTSTLPISSSIHDVVPLVHFRSNSVGSKSTFWKSSSAALLKSEPIQEKDETFYFDVPQSMTTDIVDSNPLTSRKDSVEIDEKIQENSMLKFPDLKDQSNISTSNITESTMKNNSFGFDYVVSDNVGPELTRNVIEQGPHASLHDPKSPSVNSSQSISDEYTKMECSQNCSYMPTSSIQDGNFNLMEVHSFVSDSTESCHSSAFSNRSASAHEGSTRAYSFSSRPSQQISSFVPWKPDGSKLINEVIDDCSSKFDGDPRQRAHSLGSKRLKPFVKAGTRGLFCEGLDRNPARKRADSFELPAGIGKGNRIAILLKYLQKETLSTIQRKESNPDLAEWDFSAPLAGSASGSIASNDSPNNSRSSSFGVNGSSFIRTAAQEVLKARCGRMEEYLADRRRTEFKKETNLLQFPCTTDDDYVLRCPLLQDEVSDVQSCRKLSETHLLRVDHKHTSASDEMNRLHISKSGDDFLSELSYIAMESTWKAPVTLDQPKSDPNRPEESLSYNALSDYSPNPHISTVPCCSTTDQIKENFVLDYASLTIHDTPTSSRWPQPCSEIDAAEDYAILSNQTP